MSMIKRFKQFSAEENKVEINLLYSAMTGLAIINPRFFDFLEDNKNRYTYLDRNFWQSFIMEIRTNKKIKVSFKHIQDLKHISIEEDWLELRQCIKAANIIRKKYFNIRRININDDLVVITDTERIRFKDKDYIIEEKDIEKVLGFNLSEIYTKDSWHNLIKQYVEIMKMYLNTEFGKVLQVFLDDMFEKQITLNWETFQKHKIKGLGVKVDSLPKLYYNNLYDFSEDVIYHQEAFREYELFLDIWKEKRENVLYYDTIKSLIGKNVKKRKRNFRKFISKIYSIDDENYLTFDKKLNIKQIPSKTNFKKKRLKILSEKTFLNEKNLLVLQIDTNIINIDIVFDNKKLSPSKVKINYEIKV